jgi:hypothetical protein
MIRRAASEVGEMWGSAFEEGGLFALISVPVLILATPLLFAIALCAAVGHPGDE